MLSIKKIILPILFVFFGAVFGALFAVKFWPSLFFQTAVLAPDNRTLPEASASPMPPVDAWQSIVSEAARSNVIVQIFQNEQLFKSGNGVLVSADGLIIAISDSIPDGSQYIYQVLTGDKILRGKLVSRNLQNNLVLLKVDGNDFNIADLDQNADIQSGKELILAGKVLDVSQPVFFSQRGLVSQSSGRLFLLDTPVKSVPNGVQAVDVLGKSLGLVFVRSGRVWLISADTITQTVSAYLTATSER